VTEQEILKEYIMSPVPIEYPFPPGRRNVIAYMGDIVGWWTGFEWVPNITFIGGEA
jgi:hypothetical protein